MSILIRREYNLKEHSLIKHKSSVLVFYEEKTKELTDALDAAYKPAKSGLAIIDDSKSL